MSRRPMPRRKFFRPLVEHLEDRRLLAAVITVNSTADSNTRDAFLTLREAILINSRSLAVASLSAAELLQVVGLPTNADADTIRFDIPPADTGHVYYKNDGVAGGVSPANVAATTAADDATIADIDPDWPHSWYSIKPTAGLPEIRESVLIDGYSQGSATPAAGDDASPNTNPAGQGLNSVLRVEISGENAGAVFPAMFYFVAAGGNSTLRGLAINRVRGVKILLSDDVAGSGAATAGNSRFEGNYIGPDISGTLALAAPTTPGSIRGLEGVRTFVSASNNNIIGGVAPAARNLISGNAHDGVALGFGIGHRVEGNLIGTDRTGTRRLGNASSGVLMSGGSTLGGATPAAGNVIAGNLIGAFVTGGTIQNNWIGTNAAGAADVGNRAVGVLVQTNGSNTRILENTVAFNGYDTPSSGIGGSTTPVGIRVLGSSFAELGNGNLISRNSIYSNFGPGIALENGANLSQNYPVLTSVTALNPGARIQGTLSSVASSNYRLEFYANSERDEDFDAKFGEGQTLIGTLEVTTDASGLATFSVDLAVDLLALPGPTGQPFVTATATDITDSGSGPRNNTSEFSAVAPLGGPKFVITNTGDAGLGTLREAIYNANFTPGAQTITFAIPASDPRHLYYKNDGVAGEVTFENMSATTATDDATISDIDPDWPHSWFGVLPTRGLPTISDTLTIDGYSQAASSRNTLPFFGALNTVLKIELDGRNVAGDGLHVGIRAGGSRIEGLSINAFGGNGIELDTLDGGNTIAGNFIGPDISGLLNFGNGDNGVFLVIDNFDVIGGPDVGSSNLISGNVADGIEILSGVGGLIQGNRFGGNRLDNAYFVTSGNAIFGHNNEGLISTASKIGDASGAIVAALTTPPANQRNSHRVQDNVHREALFRIDQGVAHGIGLTAFSSSLPAPKIEIVKEVVKATEKGLQKERESKRDETSGSTQAINTTAVTSLSFLGLDLGGDGVTPNDIGDTDDGPNGLQNFPAISSATSIAGGTVIAGSLNSLPNETFRVELYSNTIGPTFRAGEQFLGFVNVTTNAQGNASFAFSSPTVVPAVQYITSTATRLEDHDESPATPLEGIETSEFSDVIAVRQNPWHNQAKALDVKPDGKTVAGDALEIINYINAFGSGLVPPNAQLGIPAYYDTSNDAFVAPNDVLEIVNYINAFGADGEGAGEAEGEATATAQALHSPLAHSDWLALLELDVAQNMTPRRRAN